MTARVEAIGMSRRSLVARLVACGTGLVLGSPTLARQTSRSAGSWNFGAAHLDGVRINDAFTIQNINIEGLGVSNVPTLGMRAWLSTSTVGNVGLPLIAQFDVVFDVTAGFVWLRPLGPRRRLPMLKDRSGLGLAASPTALTVVHVAANSPAEKAGWAVGDRIVAVNGHSIDANYTRGELWQVRSRPAGTLVKLTMASGDVRELRLADYY